MYDIVNLQMVKIVAGLDPTIDKAAYLRALGDLNILKTIDAVETTDSMAAQATTQAATYQAQATTAAVNARNSIMTSVNSIKSSF